MKKNQNMKMFKYYKAMKKNIKDKIYCNERIINFLCEARFFLKQRCKYLECFCLKCLLVSITYTCLTWERISQCLYMQWLFNIVFLKTYYRLVFPELFLTKIYWFRSSRMFGKKHSILSFKYLFINMIIYIFFLQV